MNLETLRRKRIDGSPVWWQGAYGRVIRIARDGSWADMEWFDNARNYLMGFNAWRKRQPLDRLSEWKHG